MSIGGNMLTKQERYMTTRIQQLQEDMMKAHDPHDKQWYNRCIQELTWALQMKEKPTKNCYMEDVGSDAINFELNKFV